MMGVAGHGDGITGATAKTTTATIETLSFPPSSSGHHLFALTRKYVAIEGILFHFFFFLLLLAISRCYLR